MSDLIEFAVCEKHDWNDERQCPWCRIEQLEGVYDAVQNLSYADAVSGAEQWVDLREAMAAATEHGYGAWTCDCGKVNPETMHGCLACGFPDAALKGG